MRQVIIYPGEDGYWVVECPSLPGCISQGKTREEAIRNIKEAIQGYAAALEEDGLNLLSSRSCPSADGHPETMKMNRPLTPTPLLLFPLPRG
jgi:predicted RNase H-like HicB family nuclease